MWENNTENVESVEHIINPWTQELRKLHKAHKVCYKGSTVLSYYFLFKIYMCGLGQRSFSVEERRFSVFLPFFFFSPKRGKSLERQWRDVLQSLAHTAVGKAEFLKPQKEFWGDLSTQDIIHMWITNRCLNKDAGLHVGCHLLEFHYRFLTLALGCLGEVFLYYLILSESIPDLCLPRKAECSCFSWHRSVTPACSYCCSRKHIPETKEEFL